MFGQSSSEMATSANVKTSTPNVSRQVELTDTGHSPDVSLVLLEQVSLLLNTYINIYRMNYCNRTYRELIDPVD